MTKLIKKFKHTQQHLALIKQVTFKTRKISSKLDKYNLTVMEELFRIYETIKNKRNSSQNNEKSNFCSSLRDSLYQIRKMFNYRLNLLCI